MSSRWSLRRHPAARPFSTEPAIPYILAIAIPLLLFWLYRALGLIYCAGVDDPLTVGLCRYDYEENMKTGGHHGMVIWGATFLIPIPLVAIPLLAPIYAPLFLIALFLERRLHISKGPLGLLYWMVAWSLIGVSPLAVLGLALFAGKVSETGLTIDNAIAVLRTPLDPPTLYLLVAHGTVMGMIYCILAFSQGRARSST
jgi:hypothetical protein